MFFKPSEILVSEACSYFSHYPGENALFERYNENYMCAKDPNFLNEHDFLLYTRLLRIVI